MRRRSGGLRRQFVDVLDRAFVPREVFLRADGRVRYVKITRRQQMAAAAIVTGFAGWTLASTASLVVGSFILGNQTAERHEAERAYAQLRSQVAASRARFAEMASALSNQQRHLLDLVNSRSSTTAAASADSSAAATEPSADPVQQSLSETAASLAAITSNNQALGQQLAAIESRVGAADEARERAAAARDRYAAAVVSPASERALPHEQVATLADAVTLLRTEVATLDGSRLRTSTASVY